MATMISNKGSSKNANFGPRFKKLKVNKRVKKHENRALNWLELPEDVTIEILQRVEVEHIFEAVQFVCVKWHNICKEPYMWQSIKLSEYTKYRSCKQKEMLCRHAVERSCGQLNHIIVGVFGTSDLLRYIIDQSPQLRSLHLVACCRVFRDNRFQVANKLPKLEELYLCSYGIGKEVVEFFGHNCPQLKSLCYDNEHYENDNDLDGALLAIGQTMPGLRHLWLCDGSVTNDVLKAILDRCPHITSLDIRFCENVKVDGDFGRTLALRVKNLTYQRAGD